MHLPLTPAASISNDCRARPSMGAGRARCAREGRRNPGLKFLTLLTARLADEPRVAKPRQAAHPIFLIRTRPAPVRAAAGGQDLDGLRAAPAIVSQRKQSFEFP
ncbi:MAG: hypothetical protein L0Y50_06905 [Beijerinckiaceae bacterium]|nr:hypothetical protein [Beijerinckiaceae bacterium]MCI0735988.1 hypothetical protein [Beijerinckiaceae bacterium]